MLENGMVIITLTIAGTQYEELEFHLPVTSFFSPIRHVVGLIISTLQLPTLDSGGGNMIYLLGKMNEESEECFCFDYEDNNGRELTLDDYHICEGDHLYLITVPVAGDGGEYSWKDAINPSPVTWDNDSSHTKVMPEGIDDEITDPFEQERLEQKEREQLEKAFETKTCNFKPLQKEKRGAGRKLLERLNILRQKVYGSIFAPAEIKPLSHMLVQVYLHLYEEMEMVKELAKESQKEAERRDFIPLQCELKKGDRVDVLLTIHGKTLLMSEKKSLVWKGSFTKCSFDYFVPYCDEVNQLSCIAMLSVNGIPVGEMSFVTNVVDSPRELNLEVVSHNYQKVFISYSHKDVSKVKSFHEGLKLFKIEHFFDRDTLEAGAIFSAVIQEYIDTADLFVLFWSKNAAQSDYVQKEITQALERAYPQVQPEKDAKLRIYPLSIEPRAELPKCMKPYYHFGEM